MRLAMPLLLAETTRLNVATVTKCCMPHDEPVALSKRAKRPETVLNITASTELHSQAPQAAKFQASRRGDSVRPRRLLENGPAAPENHFTSEANLTSNVLNGADTRKPLSFTMLSSCRRVVASEGTAGANTTNVFAKSEASQQNLIQRAPIPQANRLIDTGQSDLCSTALSPLTGSEAGMRRLLASGFASQSGKTPSSWRLDRTNRRCTPNSSAIRTCRRSLSRYDDVLSPGG
ncbi:hypothetical protein ACE103_07740 [Bradyrhizobium sp. ma5]|uniref:hypothetical protein n=1 Tax=Bradyrhizobium sp. ma5 TaxID=3344828 RepID=UPI0035D41E20